MTLEPAERDENEVSAALDKSFLDFDANVPAETIMQDLRRLEPACVGDSRLRARLCHAQGIGLNRLGLEGEALGSLFEAQGLFASLEDATNGASVWRAIAQIHVWQGDGPQAAFALLRAVAEGGDEPLALALSLLEAARLNLELGQPRDAAAFLKRAIAIGGTALASPVLLRAKVTLLQALVASEERDAALRLFQGLELDQATSRLKHLAAIEHALILIGQGDLAIAASVLRSVEMLLPPSPQAFERVEHAQAEARLALARGDAEDAVHRLTGVIARYAEDDLAGREVAARLRSAEALDQLQRWDDADRTLAAALRRAIARGLSGYADTVRERFFRRGRPQQSSEPAEDDIGPAAEPDERRFVRARSLGHGGFGSVSRAYDLRLGTEVALKTVKLGAAYDDRTRASLLETTRREVFAAARLQHPGIGKVYGALMNADGDLVLVREYIEGPVLRDAAPTMSRLADKLTTLLQLAQALTAVHAAAIVHRDLKPENVVLRDGRRPVIIDFGISQIGVDDHQIQQANTPAYAAPEQIKGGPIDARADLYAFGTIAFEWIVGRLPPRPKSGIHVIDAIRRHRDIRDALRPAVPGPLADMIAKSLSGPRRFRPRSAEEFAIAIQREIDRDAAWKPF